MQTALRGVEQKTLSKPEGLSEVSDGNGRSHYVYAENLPTENAESPAEGELSPLDQLERLINPR